jgi:hypothetical protein
MRSLHDSIRVSRILGHRGGAELTYLCPWFAYQQDPYYFPDLLALIRSSPHGFHTALADRAAKDLDALSGTPEHARAVTVLGYLADDALVAHLEQRFRGNAALQSYENHALKAVGSIRAEASISEALASRLAERFMRPSMH